MESGPGRGDLGPDTARSVVVVVVVEIMMVRDGRRVGLGWRWNGIASASAHTLSITVSDFSAHGWYG